MQLPLHAESCTISNSAAGFNTELGLISSQIINNLSRSQEETSLPYKGEKPCSGLPGFPQKRS